jgi:hypothetical protein
MMVYLSISRLSESDTMLDKHNITDIFLADLQSRGTFVLFATPNRIASPVRCARVS